VAREIRVSLVGDSRSLERAFGRGKRAAKDFDRGMSVSVRGLSNFAQGLTGVSAAIGAAGIGVALKSSIDAASSLNEEINKSRVLFDTSSASIVKWSKTTAAAIGLSQRAALQAAGNFGAMFKTIGAGDQEAAGMAQTLVQLGADMASFNNEDPSEMLDKLRSGLAGEAEPLRRFGVLLSEARVKAEAYRSGIARAGDELTEQQKVTARYRLILRDTTLQQGDFARTSGSLANQQRTLRGNLENLAATVGQALSPKVTELVTQLNKWLGNTENQKKVQDVANKSVKTGSEYAGVLAEAGGFLAGVLQKVAEDARGTGGEIYGLADALGLAADESGRLMTAQELLWAAAKRRQLHVSTGIWGVPIEALDPYGPGAPTTPGTGFAEREGGTSGAGGGGGGGAGGVKGKTRADLIKQRNQWFDAMIGRALVDVQDIAAVKGQIARLEQISGQLTARIAVTKDITRKLKLEDDLKVVQRERRGLEEQLADDADAATRAATRRKWARIQREATRKRVGVEREFGWLAFAAERAEATKTIADDLRVARKTETRLKERIASEGRTLELVRQLWLTRDKIRDLNKKKSKADPLAGLMQASSKQLLAMLSAGTGLGPGGLRALRLLRAQSLSDHGGGRVAESPRREQGKKDHPDRDGVSGEGIGPEGREHAHERDPARSPDQDLKHPGPGEPDQLPHDPWKEAEVARQDPHSLALSRQGVELHRDAHGATERYSGFRDFVDATATIDLTEKEAIVQFQKRAHNPLLLAAGFDKECLPIPWLANRTLRLVFG
jgi:hypothetical protein